MRYRARRVRLGSCGAVLPGTRATPFFVKSAFLTAALRGLWLVSVACPNRCSAPVSSGGLPLTRRCSVRSNGGRVDTSKRRAFVVHAAASGRQASGVVLRAVLRPADGHKPVRAGPDARRRARGLHGPENRLYGHPALAVCPSVVARVAERTLGSPFFNLPPWRG